MPSESVTKGQSVKKTPKKHIPAKGLELDSDESDSDFENELNEETAINEIAEDVPDNDEEDVFPISYQLI
jgi:hypothetical protein